MGQFEGANAVNVLYQGAPTKPASANAVQEMSQRLSVLWEKFGSNAERLERVVDRAFGSSKGDGQTSGGQPRSAPSGEIGAILERLDDLSALADRQAGTISKIDTII